MIETLIRLVAGALWDIVLYGTGRLVLGVLSLGRVRAESMPGEAIAPWHGVGRDPSGALVVSQTWTGVLGGAVWLLAFFAVLAALGRL